MRPTSVEVDDDVRVVLERRAAASTTARRDWQRAKAVLLALEGMSSTRRAPIVGLNRNQIDTWPRRFVAEELDDQPRPGRPAVYGPEVRLEIVKTITSRPPEAGLSSRKPIKARMSMPEVGALMRANGTAISDSQVWRICSSLILKPWQVEPPMTSHDPKPRSQSG